MRFGLEVEHTAFGRACPMHREGQSTPKSNIVKPLIQHKKG